MNYSESENYPFALCGKIWFFGGLINKYFSGKFELTWRQHWSTETLKGSTGGEMKLQTQDGNEVLLKMHDASFENFKALGKNLGWIPDKEEFPRIFKSS